MKFSMYPRNQPIESREDESSEDYEDIAFTFEQLPEAKDWKDGETYELTLKQKSHSDDGVVFEIIEASDSNE